jgi:hypothetical protein
MGASNILINHNPEGIKMPFKKGIGEIIKNAARKTDVGEQKTALKDEPSEPFFFDPVFSNFLSLIS